MIPLVPISAALGIALVSMPATAEMRFHYDCRVVFTEKVAQMGRQGETVDLIHFKCRVSGGMLDRFVVSGTNLLELHPDGATLIGSTVIAQRGASTLAYEVHGTTRRLIKNKGRVVGWESTGSGVYQRATGSAAPLEGKTFNAIARSTGPGTFTIDTVVSD